ncbi:hypothetical protein AB6A40_007646 [Gnathostoma spinigerum]|uniref:Uncharacterized protein n=1 Tax=Gnathostoma spinigerum TaxID=75299 RepID=A0ABD6EP15_9BILA
MNGRCVTGPKSSPPKTLTHTMIAVEIVVIIIARQETSDTIGVGPVRFTHFVGNNRGSTMVESNTILTQKDDEENEQVDHLTQILPTTTIVLTYHNFIEAHPPGHRFYLPYFVGPTVKGITHQSKQFNK